MSRPPFIADVVALRRHHGHREALRVVAPVAGMAITGSHVPEGSPVTLDVTLEAVEGGIVVAGAVSAPFVGECRRCLGPVTGTLVAPVEEIFVKDPEEGETYPILGDHIDLEPLAREAIVLALPLAPLCRDDCAGLCPTCGADRNTDPCGCETLPIDDRWAALDVLRTEDPR
ncbi:MAG: YceD family protein [Acidimicrobiales bacterium]